MGTKQQQRTKETMNQLILLFTRLGADGGTIPTRDELVKLKAKDEVVDPNMLSRVKWFSCALTQLALQPPIVADNVGNLFNKESIVRALLEKRMPDEFRHIQSIKDVFDVHFFDNPEYNKDRDHFADKRNVSPFICPISFLEVGHMP